MKYKNFNKDMIPTKDDERNFKTLISAIFVTKNTLQNRLCKRPLSAHQDCNINYRLTDKMPVIFHNLKGYDSHFIMQTIVKIANKHTYNLEYVIKEQYGASILSQCRKLEKTELKYARYTNHLQYSLRCLHNNLIPNDLCLKPKLQDPKSRKILDKASRLLLQNRIHENHYIRKTYIYPSNKQQTIFQRP